MNDLTDLRGQLGTEKMVRACEAVIERMYWQKSSQFLLTEQKC
jgi:hypothetical protein